MDLKLLKMRCKDSKQHHVMFHELYSISSLIIMYCSKCSIWNPIKSLIFKKPLFFNRKIKTNAFPRFDGSIIIIKAKWLFRHGLNINEWKQ